MFLLLLLTSLIALVVLIVVGFYVLVASSSSNWVSDMWSHMRGMMGTSNITIQNPAAPYLMVMVVVIVGVVIVGAGGLVYFFVFPEIRLSVKQKKLDKLTLKTPRPTTPS